ncbi:hypothetical protein Pint_03811 [Pistacia integerrima]|uniref:Uncharacterized protein n=1 Tax=Pistacia integerrima TaxID=434235 RepID=A0ACC0Z3J0_9ROSI|nr:hypothetical protein Pint_03811 [Pistacia integerrima]
MPASSPRVSNHRVFPLQLVFLLDPFENPRKFRNQRMKPGTVTPLPELIAEPTNTRSMSLVGTHEYLAPETNKDEGNVVLLIGGILGSFCMSYYLGKPQTQPLNSGHHHELRASQMENNIYTLLNIDRWESLNHMGYNLASLRPVYVKLALRFLNWVWFGTQSLDTLALFNSSCSC